MNRLIINPEHKLEHFSYPVHLKKAEGIDRSETGQYFLSLHRHPESGKVKFTDLSPAFVRVIEILGESALNIDELSIIIGKEFGLTDPKLVREHIQDFIITAYRNKLILGFEIK